MTHANRQTSPHATEISRIRRRRASRRRRAAPRRPALDSSGYAVFSEGEAGAAHVLAHEALDRGQLVLGRRRLGDWLDGRTGHGSDWVHLHFHMAVFELALGDRQAAERRFRNEILPAATLGIAQTDAPGLLWRLAISAPRPLALPWSALRRAAIDGLGRTSDPFVTLHHLLALAGAGDTARIDAWIRQRPEPASAAERLLHASAAALRLLAQADYAAAAPQLRALVPALPRIGGSRAQNELFEQLSRWCAARAQSAATPHGALAA